VVSGEDPGGVSLEIDQEALGTCDIGRKRRS
jgi:hypothetical protein